MVKMLENTSDMLEFNNQKIADILLPNTILMLAGCALSIVGNITVMHIHWRKLNSADNFRKFIPYLALSDCIGDMSFKLFLKIHAIIIFQRSNISINEHQSVVLPY
jgi:TRAP-type C4-dicarboxylate transport system permease small subunit